MDTTTPSYPLRPRQNVYISMADAAREAGYIGGPHNLNRDACKGRLRTVVIGARTRMTTRPWMAEYLASLREGGYQRGKPRHKHPPALSSSEGQE